MARTFIGLWGVGLVLGCGQFDLVYDNLCRRLPDCSLTAVRDGGLDAGRWVDAGTAVDSGMVADAGNPVDAGTPCIDTLSSSAHCGFCNRVCESGQCQAGMCEPSAYPQLSISHPVHALAIDSTGVYAGQALFCSGPSPTNGCNQNKLVRYAPGVPPKPLAENQHAIQTIVVRGGTPYWTTWQESAIWTLDGGVPVKVKPTSNTSFFGLVADDEALFGVTNGATNDVSEVHVVSWNKPTANDVFPLPASGATQVALCDGDLYVAMQVADGGVVRVADVARPGERRVSWVIPNLDSAWGVACDERAVYASSFVEAGRIVVAPRDGGVVSVLAQGLSRPRGFALDFPSLYVVEFEGQPEGQGKAGRVLRIQLQKPNQIDVVANTSLGGTFIALDQRNVYWTNVFGNSLQRVSRLP